MRWVAAGQRPYRLRLQRPLHTARGLFTERRGTILWLEDASGRRGLGDAAVWPGFGSNAGDVDAAVARLVETLPGQSASDLEAFPAQLKGWKLPPEAAYAAELAYLDLLAQAQNVPLAALLCRTPQSCIAVHVLVANAAAAQEAVRSGAQALKIKLGAQALSDDVMRVGAVRAAVGSAIKLRLDVNGAWSREVALRAARALAAYEPEWLEQPVDANDVEGLRAIRALGAVPIAADEAVQSIDSLQAVLQADAADVVVLKPMFAGGLLATQDLHKLALEHGVRSIVTHALESAVGRLGTAHLACALYEPQAACGLNSPLAEDVGAGPRVHQGFCFLPEAAGLGVTWQEALTC